MPTPSVYEYEIDEVNIDQLTANIENSNIVTALNHITQVGNQIEILFKDVLSETDESILDDVVAAYVYHAPTNPIQKVEVTTQPSITISSTPAFASKTFGTKNLFKRVVGKRYTLEEGDNTLIYVEQFPWVKFMAIEIINGEIGDYVSLYVLDTVTGTYSGVPNYTLNQFGFEANVGVEFYQHKSEFDADVYQDLQIKLVYHSVSAKTIGINFVMNEVK